MPAFSDLEGRQANNHGSGKNRYGIKTFIFHGSDGSFLNNTELFFLVKVYQRILITATLLCRFASRFTNTTLSGSLSVIINVMKEINRFFNDKNEVRNDADIDRSQSQDYLEAVKAFSRLTYQSLYVIDYQTKAFDYVSENPLFLCGKSSEEVKELGYNFYFQNVKPEDVELLIRINEAGFNFYESIPVNERKHYSISYDFYLINSRKNMILVNHKLTPMFLTEEGQIWKALCIVSLSNSISSGNIVVSREGSDELWKYDPETDQWKQDEKIKLSQREYEILSLYASGLTINEIADKIFISADTVKFHRKKLFEKIGVNNIAEALTYAKTNKLL